MKYISYEQLLLLHSLVIDETGGLHGVRDQHSLLALVDLSHQKAFGEELYKGIFMKAALYVRNIIKNHPFLDGNKRTALTSALVFLEINDISINDPRGELLEAMLKIAQGEMSKVNFAQILRSLAESTSN